MGLGLYHLKIKIQDRYLIPVLRRHPKLADLYYFLFSSEFSREHQKVMNGRFRHVRARALNQPNAFHLRREVHRIEKGLVMRTRRPVFATDYIHDVVHNYRLFREKPEAGQGDAELLHWTRDVLNDYFSKVDNSHPAVAKSKAEFDRINGQAQRNPATNGQMGLAWDDRTWSPYTRADAAESRIDYPEFMALTRRRRSVRWFLDKPVPRELIEKAVAAAAMSPSACNRQPFRFHAYDRQELKDKIGSIPMGIRGIYDNVPVFVVVVGNLSAYLSERDRHVMYVDGGLASMAFLFAVETLGLAAFPINWPDIEELEQKMERAMGLSEDERPMMLIGMGYPEDAGGIPFSQKKPVSELLRFN